jgi:hypothetical protein
LFIFSCAWCFLTAVAIAADPTSPAISNPVASSAPQANACNGSPLLCNRRYDQVAYATTHNCMSSTEDHFLLPNQHYNVTRQLNDGIRAFMPDLHYVNGRVYLAHGTALMGCRPLCDTLAEFKTFMDAHPREVITLIFESYVHAADVEQEFRQAGLLDYLHTQTKGQPWPTLAEMVSSGRRMVIFTDHDAGRPAWYHNVWDFCWETPFAAKLPSDLDSRKGRGSQQNSLFILNHFLTNPVALPALAESVNHNPFFLDRVQKCQRDTGRFPNFITVDFYDIGDVLEVVDTLNGVKQSSTVSQESASHKSPPQQSLSHAVP